jgi:hypothetical protein
MRDNDILSSAKEWQSVILGQSWGNYAFLKDQLLTVTAGILIIDMLRRFNKV